MSLCLRPKDVSRDFLYQKYIIENLSYQDICKIINCSPNHVFRLLRKFNIKRKRYKRHPNLVGKNFGKWSVIKKNKSGRDYECICECGNKSNVNATVLVTGRSSQCRQCAFKAMRSSQLIPNYYWAHVVIGAKKRKLEFSIDQEYAEELLKKQNFKCALSGKEIHLTMSVSEYMEGNKSTASLDRIDSNKGYIKGNVQWVHKKINIMKQSMDDPEFIQWCIDVTNYHKNL